MRMLSVNVQTLAEGPGEHYVHFEGRMAYIREQFATLGVHVASLQETRTSRAETFLSGNFIRLCSGATDSGHLGTEVWFARKQSASIVGFLPDELTVLYWSPRCLCVKVCSPFLRAIVIAVHAPTAQDPERPAWWKDLRRRLQKICAGFEVCVLGDFNARFDHEILGRIGSNVWPSRYPVPDGLYGILEEHDLWLPSTFEGVHEGMHSTWFAPGSLAEARLDYLAVPCVWHVQRGGSQVVRDFDPGHKSLDHLAVRLDVWVYGSRPGRSSAGAPRFDREKMRSPEGQHTLKRICSEAPLFPWALDADSHFQGLQEHLVSALAAEFPLHKHAKAGSFLSEATWVLRTHRIWLRSRTVELRKRIKMLGLLVAFRVWARDRPWGCQWACVAAELCGSLRSAGDYITQLRSSRAELRRAVRKDRRSWLHSLAVDAPNLPVRDVLGRLKPLLRAAGRKQGARRALPAVEMEDGSLAASPAEAAERWARHFSIIEGGSPVTIEELLEAKRCRLGDSHKEEIQIQPGDVPTRVELERALLHTSCGKAAGPDCIPGELLKYGAGCFSKHLHQLLLKLAVRADEPLAFKGGLQFHLWKGKGAPSLCENHRGILVSSVVGKAIHSVIRTRCVPALQTVATPLQIGGLPRQPVTYAAHAIRLFQHLHSKGCYFLLFVDLRDAFYRVVRQFLTAEIPSDTAVVAMFQALRLPPESFQAFRERICRASAVAQAGGSQWLCSTLDEVLCGTWFKVPGQQSLVQTTRGTRPGDCLADIRGVLWGPSCHRKRH